MTVWRTVYDRAPIHVDVERGVDCREIFFRIHRQENIMKRVWWKLESSPSSALSLRSFFFFLLLFFIASAEDPASAVNEKIVFVVNEEIAPAATINLPIILKNDDSMNENV